MSRALSITARRAIFSAQTDQVFLALLTIAHDSLLTPIRVVNNLTDITSNGNVFTAYPFTIVMPAEKEDHPPKLELVIDNVSRTILKALRELTSAPTITLEVCLASQHDTIEMAFPGFVLRQVNYDAQTIAGDLALEEISTEPFPEGSFTPQDFPGLYKT